MGFGAALAICCHHQRNASQRIRSQNTNLWHFWHFEAVLYITKYLYTTYTPSGDTHASIFRIAMAVWTFPAVVGLFGWYAKHYSVVNSSFILSSLLRLLVYYNWLKTTPLCTHRHSAAVCCSSVLREWQTHGGKQNFETENDVFPLFYFGHIDLHK